MIYNVKTNPAFKLYIGISQKKEAPLPVLLGMDRF